MIGVDRKWGIPMTIILSIFALLLTSPSAYAQAALVERIRFTEYGIYTVDRDVQGRDVLGINRAAASNVRHAATLRTIPAQIGTTFGFRYEVVGRAHAAPVELRQVVIFTFARTDPFLVLQADKAG
jgi:hypothetical protein